MVFAELPKMPASSDSCGERFCGYVRQSTNYIAQGTRGPRVYLHPDSGHQGLARGYHWSLLKNRVAGMVVPSFWRGTATRRDMGADHVLPSCTHLCSCLGNEIIRQKTG